MAESVRGAESELGAAQGEPAAQRRAAAAAHRTSGGTVSPTGSGCRAPAHVSDR